MRRIVLFLFVGAVSAAVVACQDSVVAPATKRVSLPSGAPTLSRAAQEPGSERTVITTLTISRDGGVYRVGDFDVVIPAGAVCDPNTTAYGPKHWDSDCAPANRDITVSVITQTRKGQVSIDFKPDLRFRPSAGWVTIRTDGFRDLLTSSAVRQLPRSSAYFNNFVILYVPTGGQTRVDEVRSTGDPTMVTHVDLSTGLVWRRVKHFSGYMVVSGDKCDPTTTDPTTTCVVDDGTGTVGTVSGSLTGAVLTTSVVDTTSVLTDTTSTTSVVVTP